MKSAATRRAAAARPTQRHQRPVAAASAARPVEIGEGVASWSLRTLRRVAGAGNPWTANMPPTAGYFCDWTLRNETKMNTITRMIVA